MGKIELGIKVTHVTIWNSFYRNMLISFIISHGNMYDCMISCGNIGKII